MKAGAVEFLQKPFDNAVLLEAIRQGISRRQLVQREAERSAGLQQRYRSLTTRQREVFTLVVRGLLNKQIAGELGIGERTVKIHRGEVMRRMGASSLPDLVRMAEQLEIAFPKGLTTA
jgi:FixJ family two-component response regulator